MRLKPYKILVRFVPDTRFLYSKLSLFTVNRMRTRVFNGYNNDHPSLGTDFKAQRVLDGSLTQHLNRRAKPSTFKTHHPQVSKFEHPFPLDEEGRYRTNPDLDLQHTVPTGGFRTDKRTMYSSPNFPSLNNTKSLMKTTNVQSSDFVF